MGALKEDDGIRKLTDSTKTLIVYFSNEVLGYNWVCTHSCYTNSIGRK